MPDPRDSLPLDALVLHALVLLAGQPVDTVLLALAEVVARVLAVTDPVPPEEGLRIVTDLVRVWLRSVEGHSENWQDQAERVRVQ